MTVVRPVVVLETVPDRRSRGRRGALLASALVIGGLTLTWGGTASAAPSQDPATATTVLTTTTGPQATGAPAGTTAAVEPTAATNGPDTDKVAAEDRKIWVVVGALVAVAVALMLLTIRYWHQTRPVPLAAPLSDTTRDRPKRREVGRRSRRAVAGADHAAADEAWEPRGTGEHERIDVPAARRTVRPTQAQRAAAYRAVTGVR